MASETTPYLLDTHVWIWFMEGNTRIRAKTVAILEKACRKSLLRVSAISVWEVGMLEAKGRIRFSISCLNWIDSALKTPGLRLVPLAPHIAIGSTRLPGFFHGDPADRIIVATARQHDSVLVSTDASILQYAEQGYLRVLKA